MIYNNSEIKRENKNGKDIQSEKLEKENISHILQDFTNKFN